mmetsp:Transcript_20139/g.47275  ORF Transcript_20139/g.47275 Transcript_20139/m.47275 type:complete len:98 (-) Transcript_20139:602-895(-)
MCITVGGQHFEHTRIDSQQRHIKCSSSKIENKNIGFSSGLVHTIGDGSSRRFVNDTFNLHSGDGSCILGRLTLSIIEIGRNCDHSIFDLLTQECFSR